MTTTRSAKSGRRITSTDVFCAILLTCLVVKFGLSGLISTPAVQAWSTVFTAICIQATPFLVLGVSVSTVIAVYVPPSIFQRARPGSSALAVPLACAAGAALPGCECGSVPVAASLMRRGVAAGPAVAFMLSAPAINPVVLVATAVAFPGHPIMVLARLLASCATALVVGWVWLRWGRSLPTPRGIDLPDGASPATRARFTASHDLAQALGLLVVGAGAAATLSFSGSSVLA